ncbi:MAG: aminotransferase class I/II-fold pyridoxal phosphate-dependent enzyme, partial [Anaerolineae bacterium]|nr:aminotransferase class I/II-fold pyridoxal phosphate-dependent enzyme [Anaerolineae bacterium]
DPTINRLEAMSVERLGMEAALFITSGTQGNLIALLAHCGRGEQVLLGDKSHTYLFEQGGLAALGGIMPHPLPNQPDGTLRLADIKAAINPDNLHFPRTRLLCLENTHNLCTGSPLTVEYTAQAATLAHTHGLKLHLDGARIFNAAVALDVEARELAAPADSVTFCLSKGLCAPVGSVLCGSAAFIEKARRARKLLGGGMRQAGFLAAAGIVALEKMTERLREDHRRAKELAAGLAEIPGLEVSPVSSNLIYFRLTDEVPVDAPEVERRLKKEQVLLLARSARDFRAVTHYWIQDEDVTRTLEVVAQVLRSC